MDTRARVLKFDIRFCYSILTVFKSKLDNLYQVEEFPAVSVSHYDVVYYDQGFYIFGGTINIDRLHATSEYSNIARVTSLL